MTVRSPSSTPATREELLEEMEALRLRLDEAEDTLRAIRCGEVDALVVSSPEGERIFTLKGAERLYRVLVETMSEGAVSLSDDGVIVYCNSRFASMTGLPLEQVLATPFVEYVVPEDRESVAELLLDCRSDRSKADVWLAVEGGKRLPVHLSCSVLDAEGQVGISIVVTDLSEHMRSRQLQREKMAADSANWAKSQFLANMSHEIRTPMAGILGMLDLVVAEDDLPAHHRRYLAMARSSADALLHILNDILDISKIEAGKLQVNKAPVALRRCVVSALETFSADLERKGLRTLLVFDPNVPYQIHTDDLRLRQVLLNLIGNAVKFTEKGEIEVRVDPDVVPDRVCITVRDTGIGIPASHIDAIFEAFTQADISDTRRFGGTGLGLTLCRQLVSLLGGSISVSSREGHGSAFTVCLPAGEAACAGPSELPPSPGDAESIRGSRILVAEDDPVMQQLFR
ncbi:MAG TPA: ATP-binding protein, partial [Verrucomicrobiae bacterium]|nr:ATP-binding protein [Verrucomicrobiae bacterium]